VKRERGSVLLDVGDYLFVPVEAVFVALEIKQTMGRGTIEYASEKVASVRGLRRTSAPVPYVEGKCKPKELHRIIGGLLTMDSEWRPPLGDAFGPWPLPSSVSRGRRLKTCPVLRRGGRKTCPVPREANTERLVW
jgi:hypothetical protein